MAHPAAEWYYAVKNYTGTSEEQLSAIAGEPLHLLDDSDNEWWYAISPRTEQAGYIPALFIESTQSRIARVNAVKNKKLLVPTPEEINSIRTAAHTKHLEFANEPEVYVFEDDSVDDIPGVDKKSDDLHATYGLIRVYAGIWDLEVTYKSIKVGPSTTTDEVIRTAVAKFMSVKNPGEAINPNSLAQSVLDTYSLYLSLGGEEKKIASDDFPFRELEKLDEEQKKTARFNLKKSVGEIDGTPIRVFSEENLFKTIIVTSTSTVGDIVKSAVTKFRTGRPEAFSMRMVVGGKERFLEPTELFYDLLQSAKQEGTTDSQKFFLNRKRLSVESLGDKEQVVFRVYGGQLDLDVAYRAFFIDATMNAEQIVQLTLERYNSRENPKDYSLSVAVSGEHERMIDKNEKPLDILHHLETEHPGANIKFSLKKAAGSTARNSTATIKMTKAPIRIYCDFLPKGSNNSKPVLVSENMNCMSVIFLSIEKFNLKSNLTIQEYSLYILNEETGVKRLLLPDELPLVVKNEMGKKAQIHLTKALIPSDTFPIRVYGNRVWPEEGYKTIFVNKNMTPAEAITSSLEKFKFKNCTADMFTLSKLVNGNPEPIEVEFPFREKVEDFAIFKKESSKDIPDTKESEITKEDSYMDLNTTAADVRKLLSTDSSINIDDSLGELEHADFDTAYANLSENLTHLIQQYGQSS